MYVLTLRTMGKGPTLCPMIREVACFVLLIAGCSSQTTAGPAASRDAGKDAAPKVDASARDSGAAWPFPDGALLYPDALPACNFPAVLNPTDIPDGDFAVQGNTTRTVVAGACCLSGTYPQMGATGITLAGRRPAGRA